MRRVTVLGMVLVMSACGGGGDVPGDVSDMSVIPAEYSGKCPVGAAGISFEVSHTINGGRPPFRIRSNSEWVQIGYSNPITKAFEMPPASALNADGDLVIQGKDPQFAVRYLGLQCGGSSEGAVTVLDNFSNTVSPVYTAEEADE